MKSKTAGRELDLARRLREAGIPLQLEEDALESTQSARPGLLIHQVGGVTDSRAFEMDCGATGYVLDLEIASDAAGLVVIRYFRLDLPWQHQRFYWLPDPAESAPGNNLYVFPTRDPLEYERNLVINHRTSNFGKLRRGEILDGLLLGVGWEPVPDCFHHGALVDGMISIVDQYGRSHSSEISFWIERSVTIHRARSSTTPASLWSRSRPRSRLQVGEQPQTPARPAGPPAVDAARSAVGHTEDRIPSPEKEAVTHGS